MTSWDLQHGQRLQAIVDTKRELYRVTTAWCVVPLETTIARVATSARDLLDAIDNCRQVTPIGVQSIDRHLNEALALAWKGADLLAGLPLDVVIAKRRLEQANPVLQAAFDKFHDAASAARRASASRCTSAHPG
jgi:hypothetical protein